MKTNESLLLKLGSEGAEIAHMVEKCMLFGLDEVNHLNPEGPSNRERLVSELNDILGAAAMLVEYKILPPDWQNTDAIANKCVKIAKYANFARQQGSLEGERCRLPHWVVEHLGIDPVPMIQSATTPTTEGGL